MDFEGFASRFELSSIVVWFAVLVAIFALFVGLGLFAANRGARHRASNLIEQARIDELVPERRKKKRQPADRARHPNSLSRSRRQLKHSQETS